MGFCFFNNVAIAAKAAIKSGKASKVLIVDWDGKLICGSSDSQFITETELKQYWKKTLPFCILVFTEEIMEASFLVQELPMKLAKEQVKDFV